jgi:hypothetical protein
LLVLQRWSHVLQGSELGLLSCGQAAACSARTSLTATVARLSTNVEYFFSNTHITIILNGIQVKNLNLL